MSCFSMVSASPEPSQVASEIVVPRKHLRRFSSVGNVMRSKKSGPASEANDDSDLAISYPWNFQVRIIRCVCLSVSDSETAQDPRG